MGRSYYIIVPDTELYEFARLVLFITSADVEFLEHFPADENRLDGAACLR